ncbi:hypothetical protein AOLI_G00262360 [Acnodon oligacanthus]
MSSRMRSSILVAGEVTGQNDQLPQDNGTTETLQNPSRLLVTFGQSCDHSSVHTDWSQAPDQLSHLLSGGQGQPCSGPAGEGYYSSRRRLGGSWSPGSCSRFAL